MTTDSAIVSAGLGESEDRDDMILGMALGATSARIVRRTLLVGFQDPEAARRYMRLVTVVLPDLRWVNLNLVGGAR